MKSSIVDLVYELPRELPNNGSQTTNNNSQKTRKSRYQAFLFLSSFIGFLYFVSNTFPRIVGFTKEVVFISYRTIRKLRDSNLVSFLSEYRFSNIWKMSFITCGAIFIFTLKISRASSCRLRCWILKKLSLTNRSSKRNCSLYKLISILFHECYSFYGSVSYCKTWKKTGLMKILML